ncbi:tryptophan-rich sensory protein [Streptomyces sp. McG3]|uniref:tryptophan-rich sensory protein n=1 Tax=Streptomyces sp. McG3 TaxID=2725483 RepID=UPI0020373BF4|nr:tryptophan-rich sensory protein [Streptomyces sp. McG3]
MPGTRLQRQARTGSGFTPSGSRPQVRRLICLLLAALGATVLLAARVDRRASRLLAPYLLWAGYAAALNLALWLTN